MSASRRSPADRFPAAPQLFFGSPLAPRPARRGPSSAPSPAPARRASARSGRPPWPSGLAASPPGPCAHPSRGPCARRPGATSTAPHAAEARPLRPASRRCLPPAGSSACTRPSTAAASPSPSPRQPARRSVPAPSLPCSRPSSPSTLNFQGEVSHARWQRGQATLSLRANDGSSAPNTVRPLTTPGKYVPTPLPVGSTWGSVKPWTMAKGDQFRPPPPPALRSKQWAADCMEVAAVGGKTSTTRTPQQAEAARFWAVTGPVAYMPMVHDLVSRPGRTLTQNARLYALVSLAIADSYIAVFDAKYKYSFWRPITAIRNADQDDNPATVRDAAWEPLIDTPMHPEYPCAHCINSGAAQGVLEAEFGAGNIGAFRTTSPTAPGVTHTWENLADFQAEVSNARIWGGIHYRTSAVVGTEMGRRIAKQALASVLQPK